MRDLTSEELALAPEWATHYIVDSGDDSIIYENAFLCWWRGLDNPIDNIAGFGNMKNRPIAGREFHITQHEWSDVIAEIEPESGHTLVIKSHGSWLSFDKDDVIAMARDRGVTAEDLK